MLYFSSPRTRSWQTFIVTTSWGINDQYTSWNSIPLTSRAEFMVMSTHSVGHIHPVFDALYTLTLDLFCGISSGGLIDKKKKGCMMVELVWILASKFSACQKYIYLYNTQSQGKRVCKIQARTLSPEEQGSLTFYNLQFWTPDSKALLWLFLEGGLVRLLERSRSHQ